MAQTTTHINACDVRIYIDNALGTLTDVSGSTSEASLSLTRSLGSLTTFEGEWDIVTSCKISGSISLTAVYSTSQIEARAIIEGWMFNDDGGAKSRDVLLEVPYTIGGVAYSGKAVIETYELPLSASSADPIAISAQLRTDGTWSRTTISS